MLHFNSDKFDFWKIYDAIKRFYPIGIKKDESKMYFSYPGLKELENIIVDNIHENKNFTERWESFTKEIENEIGKEIIGTTYGQTPSFSSYVLLATDSVDNLTRTKELHFFISLLGPFYTIIGRDGNTVRVHDKYYTSTNYLVVSPTNEFAEMFRSLIDKIEDRFKGYRFVPYEICTQVMEGLDLPFSHENVHNVFNALFNNNFEFTKWTIIGDTYLKYDDWIKEGYIDQGGGWTIYPPNE